MRYGLAALFTVCLAGAAGAQIDPKTAMLEQAGFEALNAGQPARAAAAFRQALTFELNAAVIEAELTAERDKVAALAAALARRVKLDSGPGSEDQADLRLLDEVLPSWRDET